MKTRITLRSIFLINLLLVSFCISAQQKIKRTSTKSSIPYLEHLPEDYSVTESEGKKYPLLIFLHGTGEKGDGSDQQAWKVAKNGPPKHIQNGHNMTFNVSGQQHSLIVISPQLLYSAGNWPDYYIDEVVQHVLQNYRVDNTRIYLTGLSLGGGGVWRYGGQNAELFAAIAPVCGAQSVMFDRARNIASKGLPVWAFHGSKDNTVPLSSTKGWINAINANGAGSDAKLTVYEGVSHNSWGRAYNTTYAYHQPNLYEWLLSHTKEEAVPPPTAPAPAPTPPTDCACDYTVPSGQHVTDGKALGLKPGDVICLKAGNHYGNLKFVNIIGSASQPIIIKNCGGQVTISADASFSLKTENSKHFRITGSGSADRYGIVLKNATLGLSLDILSTDFEVERLEIHHIGFAGIMAKTDPKCGKPYGRSEFTMQNISIHDNYIHDTQGEGIYVGNSAYAKGVKQSCGTLLPHAVLNAKVYHNKVERTGWDGIQIGSATQGCEVYGNQVEAYGKRSNSTHGNGIQLGEGTGGKCYNNIIKEGYENGIIVLGKGDNVVFNNLIINTGAHGCFIDARAPATTGSGFKFFNNTIISPGKDGVRIYATQSGLHNQVKNNLVVGGSEAVALLHAGVTNTTVSNNYRADLVADVGFVNAGSGDYRLTSKSPCIDKGADLTSYGVTFDMEGNDRPDGGKFDQGACEFINTVVPNQAPIAVAGTDKSISETIVSLDGSGSHDLDGNITTYTWNKISGPDSYSIVSSTETTTTIQNLAEGVYVFELTVKDNNLAVDSDQIEITVSLPAPVPAPAPAPSPSTGEGLSYRYYEGQWSVLPDFSSLMAVDSGHVDNFNLSIRKRDSNFGVVYEGFIDIPVSGSYTFGIISDDGSKLYIDEQVVVNNDGLHAARLKEGEVQLEAGVHPIVVTFFERLGQEVLEVYWRNTAHGVVDRELIPDAALVAAPPQEEETPIVEANAVYVNFSSGDQEAPAPWNNITEANAGFDSGDLKDEQGKSSGISLSLLDAWAGNKVQTVGTLETYPKPIVSSYYWDASPFVKRIKVSGLLIDKKYDFTFFASRLASGDRTTEYTINGKMVSLNAANNIESTKTISQIVPNAQGEVIIEVRRANTSQYAYLNSLIIKPHSSHAHTKTSSAEVKKALKATSTISAESGELHSVNVYPNPIENQAIVELLTDEATDNVYIQIIDLAGMPVFTSSVASIQKGNSMIDLNNLSHLNSGIYILSVSFGKGQRKMVRIVKN